MSFLKKVGGFFGRIFDKVKTGISKVKNFVRDKVMPIAKPLAAPISAAANILMPGSGEIINKGVALADKISGGGYG